MEQKRSKLLSNKKMAYIQKAGRGWGGAQQNIFDLIDHFRNEFKETIFLCNDSLLLEKIKTLKVKTYRIPINSLLLSPLTLIILTNILRKEKPDIIHSNHRYATLLVQLLRLLPAYRYKILHTARSVFTNKTRFRLLGDKIIANSQAVYTNLVEKFHVTPQKIDIIYDGVKIVMNKPLKFNQQNDPVFELLDTTPKTIIGCIGSLVRAKGHYNLLQALSLLSPAIQEQLLVLIVGDGPLRRKLEASATKLQIDEIVKFLGYRDDAHLIMSYCNFFVIPSIQEGLPNVLIEGYLLGKPSIVSELDYVHEIITPNSIGFSFPVGDSKRLAELIVKYVDNSSIVFRHGAKGQRLFKHKFSLKRNLRSYGLAYQRLLNLV